MPIYTYECPECGTFDTIAKYAERDDVKCPCGKPATRYGVQPFNSGKPGYQMQAVLGSGAHLKGHFGKSAGSKKKKKT